MILKLFIKINHRLLTKIMTIYNILHYFMISYQKIIVILFIIIDIILLIILIIFIFKNIKNKNNYPYDC